MKKPTLKVSLDPLSYTSFPIKMMVTETNVCLASGTGFIYEHKDKYYLITNWHNVTGRNPETKERLSDNGGIPDAILFPMITQRNPLGWKNFLFKIYDEDEKADWYIHPKHKEIIDVVAIELDLPEDFEGILYPINNIKFDDFKPNVSDEVFILGYPYNLKGGGYFPIWKKGSIATEPDIPYEGLPKLLVDTASRSGMSGSPVIWKRKGYHIKDKKKGAGPDDIFGEIQGFLGIYSGRYTGSTELEAQLGIIWKADVIEEIINGELKDKIENFDF